MSALLIKADGNFSQTDIDDEILVMSLADGDFFSLTGTACEIWRLIDGTRDRAAVIDALAAQFDAPGDGLAADVDAFLVQLREAGLLAQG